MIDQEKQQDNNPHEINEPEAINQENGGEQAANPRGGIECGE
ncbi:MAG: hypothetical protein U7123_06895 [Potamolinea sp.]